MEVYVRRGEEQFGPFTRGQIEESLANGALIEGDLAWHKGLEDWVVVEQVLVTLPEGEPTLAKSRPVPEESGSGKKVLFALAATIVIGGVAGALIVPGLLSDEELPQREAAKPKPKPEAAAKAETPEPSEPSMPIEPAPQPQPPIEAGTDGVVDLGPREPVQPTVPIQPNEQPPVQVQPNETPVVQPQPQTEPIPPAPVAVAVADKTAFGSVTRHLDRGGPFFSYLSTKQAQEWVQAIFADGNTLAAEFGLDPKQAPIDVQAGLGLAQDVYAVFGLNHIAGIGASTRDLSGGFKRNVAVLHREDAKAVGLLWSAFGQKPHELAALKLMPADTALAVQGDLDLDALLGAFGVVVGKHGTETFRAALAKDLENATVKTLLKSYGGEIGFYVTLDAFKTIKVPASAGLTGLFQAPAVPTAEAPLKEGELPALPVANVPGAVKTVEIPEPGLVIVLRVRDDGVEKLLKAALVTQGLPLQMAQAGAVPIWHLAKPVPLESAVSLQPAMARVGDYLVIASNPKLASKVVSVNQGSGPSLAATEEFKSLAADMKFNGNQFSFLSKRLVNLHAKMADAKPAAPTSDPLAILWSKLVDKGLTSQVSVLRAEPRELVLQTHTQGMGYDAAVLLAGAGVPVMVGMALAAPALLDDPAAAEAEAKFNDEMKLGQGRLLGAGMMRVSLKNGAWPKAETWSDQLLELIGDKKHFAEPLMVDPAKPKEKICTWLFNQNLSGKKSGEVPDPRNTVLLFAAESLEWNGAGDERDFPVDTGKVVTVFADGHLEVVGPEDAARLKWKP